jgi:hypothetical protein
LARTLGFALGKTSVKLQSPPRNPLVAGPSPEHKIDQHPDPGSYLLEEGTGKNPPEQHQEKKAS